MNATTQSTLLPLAALIGAVLIQNSASAQTCAGVFIRDSQSYDDGPTPNSVENKNLIVPKGTRDTFVGYVIVAGKKYYVQYKAYYHDPADVRLTPGCVLTKWPFS